MTPNEETIPNTLPTPSTLKGEVRGSAHRVDMYGTAHRALRFMLSKLLVAMGQVTFADAKESSTVLTELEKVLTSADEHIAHEDRWVRPALLERTPTAVSVLDDEHAEHATQVAELRALAKSLAVAETTGARLALGEALYLQYTVFFAETLAHMAYEERVVQPLLDRFFSSVELQTIHESLVASIPPAEMFRWLQAMVPSSNREQRTELLDRVRAVAPPEMVRALFDAVRPHLPAEEWASLAG